MNNQRLTQGLLIALILTQVPGLYSMATKYSSQMAAREACQAWKEAAPERKIKHTSKQPTRTYKDGTVKLSYHTWTTTEKVKRQCDLERSTNLYVGEQEDNPVTTYRF